ncbi:hypothetical protein ACFV9C_43670 [Kribbella sp. NPDC059898]|uniref:hypothetical protein n=1 Tax=Kribbella sp. NPDC059898 TaxID=3346995 RepID=UPI003667E3D2
MADSGPWDALIDTSAYEPVDVTRVMEALGKQIEQYLLISTVSAYLDWPAVAVSEESALWPSSPTFTENCPELADLTIGGQYGTLKAGCETATMEGVVRTLIVRPGVILGPGEYVGRGLKLLARAARGGRWLLPAPPEQPIQPVDVRDVSTFLLDSVEAKRDGVVNLVVPIGHSTCGSMIDACLALTGHRAQPVWVDPRWLAEQGIRQWTEIPLWRIPEVTWQVDGRRAAEAGVVCRPLRDTLHDFKEALDRDGLIEHPRQRQLGTRHEREAELLAAWDDAQPSSAR